MTPREGTATSVVGGSRDEPTAQALVRPFFMVMRDVLAHELSEMRLAQWDHAVHSWTRNPKFTRQTDCFSSIRRTDSTASMNRGNSSIRVQYS